MVGGGNAALCAALAARHQGASVRLLERAPAAERGGNSRFTAGAMRVAYRGVDDLARLVELDAAARERVDFGAYPEAEFRADLARVTGGRADPALGALLARESLPALVWLREQGARFVPAYGDQAFEVDGRYRFWGGITVKVAGEGPGLVDALYARAEAEGVAIEYGVRAVALVVEAGRVRGVDVEGGGGERRGAGAVVLACGGFEANAELRARHLGPEWRHARVRGTRYNEGDGIRMALDAGAAAHGDWAGCHAVAWARESPAFGDLAAGHGWNRHSYPLGIVVNAAGRRFVDEGADFRNYTYAKYGRAVLRQPAAVAWQVFDARVAHLLRDEYRLPAARGVRADTIEALAGRMDGVDAGAFLETVREFNAAVRTGVPFDPNTRDGRGTEGLDPPKSNWAQPIDTPPFEAFPVTCGITFTFGGLRVDARARVLDAAGAPVPGLFAAGELVGGLYHGNYPGGAGLTAGSVFGRIAGESAARERAR